ncbi:hypothetical protein HRW16_31835 [Streptomyces lunaelactis]|uniref:hypothetical protein n=1 Tax=Streptomyces lunaelactis TaxID=1535768 RepID=UPI0015852838|nr:hypothetical protein [Streptomyces lunaelactis]NUK38582.1 hypothetical protein [Streptomyces lunaelactis]NUK45659.1 hypothetical protein [Streptomyces lunaelactis]NUK61669.1 hypothetical protein [Streptomyces lunaelactis]NUK96338.1 hypothetical protein [Streptomyces lunaelactis]NUL34250.1 hypothetical protein [Streptomyces lunaelactis]
MRHEVGDLQEPEREQVVAALVRVLDQLRDHCRGFELDRAGRSPRVAWDSVISEGASPTSPLTDSVAVDATRFAQPSMFGTMTRTSYGHLAVFSSALRARAGRNVRDVLSVEP